MPLWNKNITEEIKGDLGQKNLHKAIMKCSRLRNKSLSERTEMSLKEFKKQQKFCVNFLKRAKKKAFCKSWCKFYLR